MRFVALLFLLIPAFALNVGWCKNFCGLPQQSMVQSNYEELSAENAALEADLNTILNATRRYEQAVSVAQLSEGEAMSVLTAHAQEQEEQNKFLQQEIQKLQTDVKNYRLIVAEFQSDLQACLRRISDISPDNSSHYTTTWNDDFKPINITEGYEEEEYEAEEMQEMETEEYDEETEVTVCTINAAVAATTALAAAVTPALTAVWAWVWSGITFTWVYCMYLSSWASAFTVTCPSLSTCVRLLCLSVPSWTTPLVHTATELKQVILGTSMYMAWDSTRLQVLALVVDNCTWIGRALELCNDWNGCMMILPHSQTLFCSCVTFCLLLLLLLLLLRSQRRSRALPLVPPQLAQAITFPPQLAAVADRCGSTNVYNVSPGSTSFSSVNITSLGHAECTQALDRALSSVLSALQATNQLRCNQ